MGGDNERCRVWEKSEVKTLDDGKGIHVQYVCV